MDVQGLIKGARQNQIVYGVRKALDEWRKDKALAELNHMLCVDVRRKSDKRVISKEQAEKGVREAITNGEDPFAAMSRLYDELKRGKERMR